MKKSQCLQANKNTRLSRLNTEITQMNPLKMLKLSTASTGTHFSTHQPVLCTNKMCTRLNSGFCFSFTAKTNSFYLVHILFLKKMFDLGKWRLYEGKGLDCQGTQFIIMKVSSIKTTVKEAQWPSDDDKQNRTESCSSCNPVPPGELGVQSLPGPMIWRPRSPKLQECTH